MIAFVRGVMAASTRSTSIAKSSSRTSTRTGRAPVYRTLAALAMKVNGTVMTSSPGPIP